MLAARIPGATRCLGAPANWNEEKDGLCGVLPILDTIIDGHNVMVSAWEPTPEELVALAAGGKVYLHIYGTVHPVVAVGVGQPPEVEIL